MKGGTCIIDQICIGRQLFNKVSLMLTVIWYECQVGKNFFIIELFLRLGWCLFSKLSLHPIRKTYLGAEETVQWVESTC